MSKKSNRLVSLFLLRRESAGALHHGNKSISHSGGGIFDTAGAPHCERCPEERRTETTRLPQQTFSLSPPEVGRPADIQAEALPSSLTFKTTWKKIVWEVLSRELYFDATIDVWHWRAWTVQCC